MSRVNRQALLELARSTNGVERQVIELVARLRLVSHAQLAALLIDPAGAASLTSQARLARRLLASLTERRLLGRLQRRVGGVRAGSSGHVYYAGPLGQRLVAYWQGHGLVRGRTNPEPGGRYVRHRLAVSQLYVDAQLAARVGELDLLACDIEPDCWRQYLDGFGGQVVLKPDAYLRVGLGAYEDRFFVEVDLGTESRPVIRRKLRAYLDYFATGQEQASEGVFPRILLLTNSDGRVAVLTDLCSRLPADNWQLFTVARLERFVAAVTGEIAAAVEPQTGEPA